MEKQNPFEVVLEVLNNIDSLEELTRESIQNDSSEIEVIMWGIYSQLEDIRIIEMVDTNVFKITFNNGGWNILVVWLPTIKTKTNLEHLMRILVPSLYEPQHEGIEDLVY